MHWCRGRARARLVRVVLVAALAVPGVGRAQPAEPPAAPVPPAAPTIDEARLRELVDREVAQVLTERAAREAAERAAREAADKDMVPLAAAGTGESPSGFMDTRLAFTITNENLLAKPGDTTPSVPGWRFGVPSSLGVLFFDNYDTRYSGFETLSHATVYRAYSRGHLEAEGALVVRINALGERQIELEDDGSYLTISNWKDPGHKDPTRISLTMFPISADRFRLGYSYRLSWGGSPDTRTAVGSTAASPGARLQYDGQASYAFIGAKSLIGVDPGDPSPRTTFAVLGGAGVDATSQLRLEANGGYFDRGHNPLADVRSDKVRLYGASAQVALHHGMPVRTSLDYQLYKFNAEAVSSLFAPERYPGGLAWLAQAEFTVLGQSLKDPATTGATVVQTGTAGDLNVRVKIDRVRLRLDLSYRDLAFILHAQPSLPAFEAFPTNAATTSDYFAAIGVDRNWSDWLTLGLIAGIERPASLVLPSGISVGEASGPGTAVVRSDNVTTAITLLPPGAGVARQVAVKGTARIDFASVFSVLAELIYSHDGNQIRLIRPCADPQTCASVPGQLDQLGVNLTLQARF